MQVFAIYRKKGADPLLKPSIKANPSPLAGMFRRGFARKPLVAAVPQVIRELAAHAGVFPALRAFFGSIVSRVAESRSERCANPEPAPGYMNRLPQRALRRSSCANFHGLSVPGLHLGQAHPIAARSLRSLLNRSDVFPFSAWNVRASWTLTAASGRIRSYDRT